MRLRLNQDQPQPRRALWRHWSRTSRRKSRLELDPRLETGRDIAFLNHLARSRFGAFLDDDAGVWTWTRRTIVALVLIAVVTGIVWFIWESILALRTFGA